MPSCENCRRQTQKIQKRYRKYLSHCRNCWLAICAATTFLPHKAGRYFPPKKDRGPEQISFVKGEGHSPNLSILLNQKQVYKGRVGYAKISPFLCSFPGWNWWERLEEKVVLSPFLKIANVYQFKLQHRHYLNLDNDCKPVSINIILFFKSGYQVTLANWQRCCHNPSGSPVIRPPDSISRDQLKQVIAYICDTVSDVVEIEVQFASKILAPHRMHWNCCKIAYFKPTGTAFRICMTCWR